MVAASSSRILSQAPLYAVHGAAATTVIKRKYLMEDD